MNGRRLSEPGALFEERGQHANHRCGDFFERLCNPNAFKDLLSGQEKSGLSLVLPRALRSTETIWEQKLHLQKELMQGDKTPRHLPNGVNIFQIFSNTVNTEERAHCFICEFKMEFSAILNILFYISYLQVLKICSAERFCHHFSLLLIVCRSLL